jgi:hypothetical protein
MRHRVPIQLRVLARIVARLPAPDDDRGQATVEYVLIVLAAGSIAIGVIAWAIRTHAFTDLYESVIEQLQQQ